MNECLTAVPQRAVVFHLQLDFCILLSSLRKPWKSGHSSEPVAMGFSVWPFLPVVDCSWHPCARDGGAVIAWRFTCGPYSFADSGTVVACAAPPLRPADCVVSPVSSDARLQPEMRNHGRQSRSWPACIGWCVARACRVRSSNREIFRFRLDGHCRHSGLEPTFLSCAATRRYIGLTCPNSSMISKRVGSGDFAAIDGKASSDRFCPAAIT